MGREAVVSNRILELFQTEPGAPKKRFTQPQLIEILDGEISESSVRAAIRRLRGEGDVPKQIRAVMYQTQAGVGGRAMPVFELGSEDDAPRVDEYVKDTTQELIQKHKTLRRQQEERRLQKELDDIDAYR